eukprot:COSAG01_NODE_4943_length_4605_cov_11.292943_3_plen_88_part_00
MEIVRSRPQTGVPTTQRCKQWQLATKFKAALDLRYTWKAHLRPSPAKFASALVPAAPNRQRRDPQRAGEQTAKYLLPLCRVRVRMRG